MYNRTELTESILKNKKAKEILSWLPQVYGEAETFLWLLEVIGRELLEMEEWSEDFENQVVPQTATWSLPYWEERYYLPVNSAASPEKRRADILLRMWQRAPINPYKLEEILTGITGLPVKVKENTGKNHFTVCFEGYAGAGLFYRTVEEIDRLKPAHLIYTIQYLHDLMVQVQADYDAGILFTTQLIARGKENLGYTKKLLDGFWRLNGYQQAEKATDLYEAVCSWNTAFELQKSSICLICSNAAFLQQSIQVDGRPDLSGGVLEPAEAVLPSVTTRTAVTCKTGYTAELMVRKNFWKLDGSILLDGSKMLNAEQYVMEL